MHTTLLVFEHCFSPKKSHAVAQWRHCIFVWCRSLPACRDEVQAASIRVWGTSLMLHEHLPLNFSDIPVLCHNKRQLHCWFVSEWDVTIGLNVAAWSVCVTDTQHLLPCHCLRIFTTAEPSLSMVNHFLMSQSESVRVSCFLVFLLIHNFLCWKKLAAALLSFQPVA